MATSSGSLSSPNIVYARACSLHRSSAGPWSPGSPTAPGASFALLSRGTRQGKTVLVQLRDDNTDPETDQRYTVKRYKSEKTVEGDSWRHTRDYPRAPKPRV